MSTEQRVLTILEQVLETSQVRTNPQLRLYDLHLLDSLQTVELMVALSDAFGFDISPAEFEPEQWATPAQIVEYVAQRTGS